MFAAKIAILLMLVSGSATPSPEGCTTASALSDPGLTLGGALVLSAPEESVAVLNVKGKGQAVRPGDEIMGRKYRVAAVARDSVCLMAVSTKAFHFLDGGKKATTQSAVKLIANAIGIKELKANRFEIPNALLQREMGNLQNLLESARAVAEVDKKGRFVGYRLQRIEPWSLFRVIGLRPNDVLTRVNNVKFENPTDGLRAFLAMKESSEVTLYVERNGRKAELHYKLI